MEHKHALYILRMLHLQEKQNRNHCAHSTEKKTETHWGKRSCPRLNSQDMVSLEFERVG